MLGQLQLRRKKFLFALSSMISLSACASSLGIHPSSHLPSLNGFQVGHSISSQVNQSKVTVRDWWKLYGDPQLNWLVAQGEEDSPSIKIAEARIATARAVLSGAKAEQQPQIGGEARLLGEYFPDHYTYSDAYAGRGGSEGEVGIDAAYHFDFWGKQKQTVKASAERVIEARYEADDAALSLQVAIVKAYIYLNQAYCERDVESEILRDQTAIVGLIHFQEQAGLENDIGAIGAEQALTMTRSDLAQTNSKIVKIKNEISALFGKGPGFGDKIARPLILSASDPAPISVIPAKLLGYRPDVEASRAEVEARAYEIGVARAAFYPDVNLVGFAGLKAISIDTLFRANSIAASIGPAVMLPIFDAGELRSKLKIRDAEYDESVNRYTETIAAALQQVSDAIAGLQAARVNQQQIYKANSYWAHVVYLEKARELKGLSSNFELLSAEISLLNSQKSSIKSDADIAVEQVSLVYALGGVWSPLHKLHDTETVK